MLTVNISGLESSHAQKLQDFQNREMHARSETEDIILQMMENREKWNGKSHNGKPTKPSQKLDDSVFKNIKDSSEMSEKDLAKIIKGMKVILSNDRTLREKDTVFSLCLMGKRLRVRLNLPEQRETLQQIQATREA